MRTKTNEIWKRLKISDLFIWILWQYRYNCWRKRLSEGKKRIGSHTHTKSIKFHFLQFDAIDWFVSTWTLGCVFRNLHSLKIDEQNKFRYSLKIWPLIGLVSNLPKTESIKIEHSANVRFHFRFEFMTKIQTNWKIVVNRRGIAIKRLSSKIISIFDSVPSNYRAQRHRIRDGEKETVNNSCE